MSIDETMQEMNDIFSELAEALERIRDALIGSKFKEFVEEAIKAEIAAYREKPSYPVIKIIRMHSTGLRSETVTRTLIPL